MKKNAKNELESRHFGISCIWIINSTGILLILLVVRQLQGFESPIISLKEANKTEKHKLLLRKS